MHYLFISQLLSAHVKRSLRNVLWCLPLIVIFTVNTSLATTLVCPAAKKIILIHGHWKVRNDPRWITTPTTSEFGKDPRYAGAFWNHGWQPEYLIKRPDCFYWLGHDFEYHVEFIFRYKTPNPYDHDKKHWERMGGLSQGVRCTATNRLDCQFPIK